MPLSVSGMTKTAPFLRSAGTAQALRLTKSVTVFKSINENSIINQYFGLLWEDHFEEQRYCLIFLSTCIWES